MRGEVNVCGGRVPLCTVMLKVAKHLNGLRVVDVLDWTIRERCNG